MYKVLIVEDELPVRDAIIAIIDWEALGFQVVYAAEDGQDALNYLEDHEIDLMITDIYICRLLMVLSLFDVSEKKTHIARLYF
jgi:YesN/AraC family two-component response regulator